MIACGSAFPRRRSHKDATLLSSAASVAAFSFVEVNEASRKSFDRERQPGHLGGLELASRYVSQNS